jgi:HPt (histidine-containing phosphotransfer) domain-containing protein
MGPVVKTLIQTAVLALSSLIASHAIADAQPSRNLAEAVKNFSEYNSRLEQAMAQGPTPESLAQIHELTYTLKDALEKINEEMDGLTDTLEEIHIASEAQNAAEVKRYGNEYLETARKVIK